MQLTWYGTAGLILKEADTALAFDPFCGLPVHSITHPIRPLPYKNIYRNVSQVFVTHGHLDHIYHIPQIYKDTDCKIHCTAAPKQTLLHMGFPRKNIIEIMPGWHGTFGPLTVTAFQGRHCVFDPPLIAHTILSRRFWQHPDHLMHLLKLHCTCREHGEILFYEVSCADTRVQIMGSMNLDPDTDYPTDADILVLPLQGRSDLDTYGLALAERLKPRQILLDHYDNTFPPLSDCIDPSGFIQNAEQKLGIPCRPLQVGQKISVN